MGYTVRITKRQLRYFSKLAKTEGKVLIKHLPDSSDFSSKEGSWKNYWLSLMKKSWPKVGAGKEEQVGCHVVDIETGCVYICPRSGNENTTLLGMKMNAFSLSIAIFLSPLGLKTQITKVLVNLLRKLFQRHYRKFRCFRAIFW